MLKSPIRLLLIQVMTIPLVIGIFRLPMEKAKLSLIANGVFWCLALLTLSYRGPLQKWIQLSGLQFLLLAVVPVTILRYLSWGGDFNTSAFLGVTGAQWHSYSNISYSLLLLVSFCISLGIKLNLFNSK